MFCEVTTETLGLLLTDKLHSDVGYVGFMLSHNQLAASTLLQRTFIHHCSRNQIMTIFAPSFTINLSSHARADVNDYCSISSVIVVLVDGCKKT